MIDLADGKHALRGYHWWLLLGAALVIALSALMVTLGGDPRALKPARTLPPAGTTMNAQPLLVTFAELEENPSSALNQRLRLTGAYSPTDAGNCTAPRGPQIRWRLVADELQLNAIGYETVLKLLPAGTTLTVDGIWRQYAGRAGCGKNAPQGIIWYLEVERIVQPNPLFRDESGGVGTGPGGASTPPLESVGTLVPVPPADDATPQLQGTPGATVGTPVPLPLTTATPASTAPTAIGTSTPATGGPTVTATGPSRTPGPSATGTAPTSPAGTSSPQPSATPFPTPPSSGGSTNTPFPTPPPLITATPGGGYPGPAATATTTPTPESYP
jgi:hypothetical protein